jgi:cytidine deaminase
MAPSRTPSQIPSRKPAGIDWDALAARALEQRDRAYAPYSRFRVGAALLTADGRVFGGSNVENRAYGLTLCAERVALGQAVAAGATELAALVVATAADPPAAPCGQCRDSLAEFARELPILLVGTSGRRVEHDLAELLPHPFRLPD